MKKPETQDIFEYWYDEYIERVSIRMAEGKQGAQWAAKETYKEISDRMRTESNLKDHEAGNMLIDIKKKARIKGIIA